MTRRETARQALAAEVPAYIQKQHEKNYEKLHVWSDGSLCWREYINQSDDTIDGRAARFQAVPSVACVGTGSVSCDCDWCRDGGDIESYDMDGSENDAIEACMVEQFDTIERGYFDDEEPPYGP